MTFSILWMEKCALTKEKKLLWNHFCILLTLSGRLSAKRTCWTIVHITEQVIGHVFEKCSIRCPSAQQDPHSHDPDRLIMAWMFVNVQSISFL